MKKPITTFCTIIMVLMLPILLFACNTTNSSPDNDYQDNIDGSFGDQDNNNSGLPDVDDNDNNTNVDNDNNTDEPEPPPIVDDSKKTYIKALSNINVRKSPNGSVIGAMDSGDLIALVETTNSWHKIKYRNGYAYISASTTLTSLYYMTKSDTYEKVIEYGESLIGTKYVYGATRLHDGNGNFYKKFTTSQFDCSSYMQYIFYYGLNSYKMSTTSRSQSLEGVNVSKNNLQRGDLLFFTNSSRYHLSGIERIGHVALYLGDNYILHTSSDYAVIEQISNARWKNYISAKRITN